jgi:hypothetical protein
VRSDPFHTLVTVVLRQRIQLKSRAEDARLVVVQTSPVVNLGDDLVAPLCFIGRAVVVSIVSFNRDAESDEGDVDRGQEREPQAMGPAHLIATDVPREEGPEEAGAPDNDPQHLMIGAPEVRESSREGDKADIRLGHSQTRRSRRGGRRRPSQRGGTEDEGG